jgi:hypothetical protein
MMQLSFAYLFAALVIAGLYLLARRNRKQGWRKQREVPYQEAPYQEAIELPVDHFADLSRLHQALIAHGEPTRPEPAKKPSVLA